MTDRVFLHVGAPKSGTTYLQDVLATNRDHLETQGVLVGGRRRLDLVHAGMVVREDPRLEDLPPRASGAWDRLVAEIEGWSGHTAVVSYELLAGATREQAARAIASLGEREVHVVITARDLARSVPSAWQERLKFGLTVPLEEWVPPPARAVRSEWGWRTLDPAGVAARWGATLPPQRVHLVPVPRSGPHAELWRRFAEACALEGLAVTLPDTRSNHTLGAAAAEVLRRVNEHVEAPVTGGRESALWLRDTLAEGVLVTLDDEPITLTDAQLAEAEKLWVEVEPALGEAGYAVHGSLDEIAPLRPSGTLPGATTTERRLEVAVAAIWRLLLLVREARTPEEPAPAREEEPSPRTSSLRSLFRAAHDRPLRSQVDDLTARLAEAQATLAESRQQQVRIGLLTDLVTELLLPGGERDDQALEHAIEQYRKGMR